MNDERAGKEAHGEQSGFDRAIEAFRQALEPYMKGDAEPVLDLFSRAEDTTRLAQSLPCRTQMRVAVLETNAWPVSGAMRLALIPRRTPSGQSRWPVPRLGRDRCPVSVSVSKKWNASRVRADSRHAQLAPGRFQPSSRLATTTVCRPHVA